MDFKEVFMRIVCMLLGGLLLGALPALATLPPAPLVAAVEKALNGILTLEADFQQNNPDGTDAQGHFYMHRPQNLKFAYTRPKGHFILAKDGWLMLYDPDLKDYSYVEVDFSPAKFFLQKTISLTKGVVVTGYKTQTETVTLDLMDQERTAMVRLLLDKKSYLLLGWTVINGSQETVVKLQNIKTNQPINKAVFQKPKGSP